MDKCRTRNPEVMGIVNITRDSFFPGSRVLAGNGPFEEGPFAERVGKMLSEGADIIDLGACSTRPGSDPVSTEEEWENLEPALRVFATRFAGSRLSIDTFRPEIVSRAFDSVGPFMVNDVSGGSREMWKLVGELGLPYVAMHTRGTPKEMQSLTDYEDVTLAVKSFFETFAETAEAYGIKDWILDPGFGFAKTAGQNWQLLREMSVFKELGRPVLVGLSRKSFICKPLGISPEEALVPTQVVDFLALQSGADILRVHDVAPAVQTVSLYLQYQNN